MELQGKEYKSKGNVGMDTKIEQNERKIAKNQGKRMGNPQKQKKIQKKTKKNPKLIPRPLFLLSGRRQEALSAGYGT